MSTTTRAWLYGKLNTPSLQAMLPGGAYQSTSIDEVPTVKPFALYRFSTQDPDLRGDDTNIARRQFAQVFFHTERGDFGPLDDIISHFESLVDGQSSDDVIKCTWGGTSEDLIDPEFNTITRYVTLEILES